MSHFIFVRIHMSWRAAIAENRKTHREINIAKKSMKNWKIFFISLLSTSNFVQSQKVELIIFV